MLTALDSRKPWSDFYDEINSSDSVNILLLVKLQGHFILEKNYYRLK